MKEQQALRQWLKRSALTHLPLRGQCRLYPDLKMHRLPVSSLSRHLKLPTE